jgi:hypothetical protein
VKLIFVVRALKRERCTINWTCLQEKALTFHMEFIEGESEFAAIAGWICCWTGVHLHETARPLWRNITGKFGIILKFREQLNSL